IVCLLYATQVQAQDSNNSSTINIFLDCSWDCDMNYIKQEIPYVNYAIDVNNADVYILVTNQTTGSGGSEMTLKFQGERDFKGQNSEIKYMTLPVSTEDELRSQMTKNLKAGLLPFLARTSAFDQLDISYNAPEESNEDAEEEKEDKWNSWIYSVGLNGWFNGQSTYKSLNTFGSISATRVTEKWKYRLRGSASFNRSSYDVDEDEPLIAKQSNFSGRAYMIRAINNHWSAGAYATAFSSTYSNLNFATRIGPALEYDLFPYEESNTKQLRFSYIPSASFNSYADTTIYLETEELLFQHSLGIYYETQAKFGSIDMGMNASQYLHDLGLFSLSLNGGVNIRVVKGLSFRLSGNFQMIYDQITLPKGDVSAEDIILQNVQLPTTFSYWGNFGINYTFGATYNNVVFPRFGGNL
ncbi:MAG: hypothetical protein ACPG5P_03615, partial [Saprospiraceae bacterium]